MLLLMLIVYTINIFIIYAYTIFNTINVFNVQLIESKLFKYGYSPHFNITRSPINIHHILLPFFSFKDQRLQIGAIS
ncbi:hypothetical protein GLOIN_2v1684112 [Rhizophagus irregularis DAOM 181602=DAOM 197198]|uniref:Uncharacterized protein n=1 Tax=Rhizophagus irregularis (strain DAOM 181602 / DAOM 197198 / MUCL 43194) TaxID=747089 RepID=A0A2P4PE71_RHIID|nr:hypothetical protein GLOIN_2v1684112 [Rhizophagus irregularis DAOM 181602=DAOM 197198]POG63662.1 hypothetical protein GLOIN_2v1684112 [Rhizophagus irregularis DAOM 181602=DAOM 197198]|eukprot:XP_025170528.1 hypothetical protein GLOIN_2v1684112 [Rhizophagus irregularis DAOM 181602=DAOM 197198]